MSPISLRKRSFPPRSWRAEAVVDRDDLGKPVVVDHVVDRGDGRGSQHHHEFARPPESRLADKATAVFDAYGRLWLSHDQHPCVRCARPPEHDVNRVCASDWFTVTSNDAAR